MLVFAKPTFVLVMLVSLALLLGACSENPNIGTGPKTTQSSTQSDNQQVSGEVIFQKSCAHCHGGNAKGLPGLGPDLTSSEFVHALNDEALLAFIIQGRPVNDPENTTGIPMPPRGGNLGLTDDDLMAIIGWIRSIESS